MARKPVSPTERKRYYLTDKNAVKNKVHVNGEPVTKDDVENGMELTASQAAFAVSNGTLTLTEPKDEVKDAASTTEEDRVKAADELRASEDRALDDRTANTVADRKKR